jgi:hypothetical protein
MFESQPTTPAPEQHASHGISLATMLTVSLIVLLIGGGGVYALMPKAVPAPTAEEIMATMPKEEADARAEYAWQIKNGKKEVAEAFAKSKGLDIAMTAVEAMHAEPAPQPAKAEKPESGNVQSPPLK